MEEDDRLIDEQIAYYRARAPEYDEWFLRKGRYDRGPEHRAAWFGEMGTIEEVLRSTVPFGDIVELACGTGLWTRVLAERAARVLAVDASPEAIAINRERLQAPNVEYCLSDIFSWVPPTAFDFVFFSFWLSHVPTSRFDLFWQAVRTMLRPRGQAFFIDSLLEPTSTAKDHETPDGSGVIRRRLNDQREFHIVKVFHEPSILERRLNGGGWEGWVRSSGRFFLYGSVRPVQEND